MMRKSKKPGRVEQVVTSLIFLALFLYLMVLVAMPLAMKMGLWD